MSTLTPMQRSLSCCQPIQFNNKKNLSLTNETGLKSHKSLNKSIKKEDNDYEKCLSVIAGLYNIDVSESGGCLAWDYNKNKQKEEEEKKKKKKNEDGCICIIY